ncbi:tyrosine-protein phosphatase [Streptomyces sp. SP17BM10]|uniref:tyrosine-protein phosphatase n=1 Tax=Streptomyces sp. SP17BM10 TaxID=3002530 RepID=UPI002E7637DE|nr:tyrosine-protein phosphatase [Streptomyces sp. SP17BM10]MEE1782940.1 tyrosine-protein phosphatase [Streptomyces sp. SP17BM10]
MSDRRLLPDHLPNLRDLGGLPTTGGARLRPGVLLRSSALSALAPAGAEELTRLLGPGGYVDLRTDREIERDGGPGHLLARGWTWHRLPVRDRAPGDHGDTPDDQLRRHLATLPRYLATAERVARLLPAAGPVIVGCSLGKDRTGIVVAVLLRALGVGGPAIVDDFALSNDHLAAGRHHLPPRWRDAATVNAAPGRVCAAVLDALDHTDGAGGSGGRPPALRRIADALDAVRPHLTTTRPNAGPAVPPLTARSRDRQDDRCPH